MSHRLYVVLYKQDEATPTEVYGPYYAERSAVDARQSVLRERQGIKAQVYPVKPQKELGK